MVTLDTLVMRAKIEMMVSTQLKLTCSMLDGDQSNWSSVKFVVDMDPFSNKLEIIIKLEQLLCNRI